MSYEKERERSPENPEGENPGTEKKPDSFYRRVSRGLKPIYKYGLRPIGKYGLVPLAKVAYYPLKKTGKLIDRAYGETKSVVRYAVPETLGAVKNAVVKPLQVIGEVGSNIGGAAMYEELNPEARTKVTKNPASWVEALHQKAVNRKKADYVNQAMTALEAEHGREFSPQEAYELAVRPEELKLKLKEKGSELKNIYGILQKPEMRTRLANDARLEQDAWGNYNQVTKEYNDILTELGVTDPAEFLPPALDPSRSPFALVKTEDFSETLEEILDDEIEKSLTSRRPSIRTPTPTPIIIALSGFLVGIFFLESAITGNAIADLPIKTGSFMGASLIILSLITSFIWTRSKKISAANLQKQNPESSEKNKIPEEIKIVKKIKKKK